MASNSGRVDEALERELEFRRQIEEFYLPQQLVNAIFDLGEIPRYSMTSQIGVAFIDIADYTYISKFLSPNENQAILNGLYTALNWVIKRHGGYLNKIEGDSLMFHFGGLTDANIKSLDEEDATRYIARELFYTCVEMQRVVSLFNQANDKFMYEEVDESIKKELQTAFDIIGSMRNSMELSAAFNALFQIRVRIGANIGEVTVGNFGPDGAKQWDVIGLPVIDAKRMESTAPIGGLRISHHLYTVLEKTGIVESYFQRFRREADAYSSAFRTITRDELFKSSQVILKDKKGVQFSTYSVQVSPNLPEAIAQQIRLLLKKGEAGADRVIDFLQYYRGNKYVIDAIETVFNELGVLLRKDRLVKTLYPKKYDAYLHKLGDDPEKTREYIDSNYLLYDVFEKLGQYQDEVNSPGTAKEFKPEFQNYDQYIEQQEKILRRINKLQEGAEIQRLYFYNVVYPLIFRNIRTSLLEYQYAPREEALLLDV